MLALHKIFPSPSPSFWDLGARSAVWETKNYPGIWLRRAEDQHGKMYWRMFAVTSRNDGTNHPSAEKVSQMLYGQKFATRREALQAVEAALIAVES